MIVPESDIGSLSWQPEGFATRIEYSCAVIEQLGIASTEGFNRLSRGGVEIGGVLYGTRTSGAIEISAYRELVCEYAFGPSFTLSDNDRRRLEELIASSATDPELARLQVVGWYHSHTRSEIVLSEKDLELYRRYFPEPWQIALVLRPFRFDPVRAGFFFREPDGSIQANATRQEFIIAPKRSRPAMRSVHDVDAIEPTHQQTSVQVLPAAGPILVEAPPDSSRLEPKKNDLIEAHRHSPATVFVRLRWEWMLISLVLVSAATLYSVVNIRRDSGLSLRAFDNGGQLRIEWNRDARTIRKGATGVLEVEEGTSKVRNELSTDELRAGSVTYMRNTGNVLVRLQLRDTDTTSTETTRFLGSPPQGRIHSTANTGDRRSAKSPAPETQTDAERGENPPSPTQVTPAASKPTETRAIGEQKAPDPVEIVSVRPAAPANKSPRFVAPDAPAARPRSVEMVPPPVTTSVSDSAPSLPGLSPELLPHLPHLPSPPESSKQAYRGPSEGKIIWAGKLARHGIVEIQGNHASQGYVTGGLPGVPVRIQVFPGELLPGGLRIFTADAKAVAGTEAPGAQNGWNRTSYVLNPTQAGRLQLVESPSAQNGWNRVRVRAERGDQTILVLKWDVVGTETTR